MNKINSSNDLNEMNKIKNTLKGALIIEQLSWKKMSNTNSLIPAIIQDVDTLQVLMLGYVNQEALEQTINSGKVTFYSRSKQRLWTKGETSGNYLYPVTIIPDCDQDALLILVKTAGPTCHTGEISCFNTAASNIINTTNRTGTNKANTTNVTSVINATNLGFLQQLEEIIDQRYQARPEKSYTTKLFNEGINRIAQKVGEEGVETALAAVTASSSKDILLGEVADLIYHLLVLLRAKECKLTELIDVLIRRHSKL